MHFLPHLAGRILGAPLLVERARMENILAVIGPRSGIDAVLPADTPLATRSAPPIITPDGIAIIPIHGTLVKRVGLVEAVSGLTGYPAGHRFGALRRFGAAKSASVKARHYKQGSAPDALTEQRTPIRQKKCRYDSRC
ncbi:MAG: hypothetical protein HQM04_02760 [Magnetococcales bacterium]|nr:hypothetical protein [Magnetococcales bacterium]MBF0113943.1 hypothetical protein [Magnetococcales bacterium]